MSKITDSFVIYKGILYIWYPQNHIHRVRIMLSTTVFAPRDTRLYPPSGMFSAEHFVALFVTLILVVTGLHLCRNVNEKQLKRITKIVALTVTVLEGIKIAYNLFYGYTWLDAWVPLAFCSLFIYASWLAGFGKGFLERLGKAFLVSGCPTAGLLFLIFPTTSLQMHPIYHYLCIYSMLFHGAMVWLGLLYLLRADKLPKLKTFVHYAIFFAFFATLALILNGIEGCNMMFLREPFNIPIKFIDQIHDASQLLYTVLISAAYLACYLPSLGAYKLISHARIKANEKGVIQNELQLL